MHQLKKIEIDPARLTYDAHGLIPVVVQEQATGVVLMLAYANEEAVKRTLVQGKGWFYSRSRGELWLKGETSGNLLIVHDVRLDCDEDALLYEVSVEGDGVACHTGEESCFYRSALNSTGAPQPLGAPQSRFGAVVDTLYDTIESRRDANRETSYTAYLLQAHEDKVLKKIGEEAAEVVMASKDGDVEHLRYEVGDLFYHTLVNCARHGITPDDLAQELAARFK